MTVAEEEVVAEARSILERYLRQPGPALDMPALVKKFLTLRLADREHEIFGVLWLDAKNRLIAAQDLFAGTLNQTSVHPRELVVQALRHNAASAICYHNHPSGCPEPSQSDRLLTRALRSALQLVDVDILDHVIVAGVTTYSFAEHGEI